MAKASKRLRSYQGADAQSDVLGRLAIQRALDAGLTAREIRTLADKQKLTIKPVGYELLQASKQTGKDIQLSQFQGADAQANVLGNYAVQQALQRGLSPQDIRKLARDQNYSFAPKALQTLEAKSGLIRPEQVKNILERTGGDLAKTVDRLANKDLGVSAGAANLLIRKAGEMPQAGTFGTSGLGQYLQGMAGTAGQPGYLRQGYTVGSTPGATGTGKLGRGLQILPGGKNYGIIPRNVVTPQITPDPGNLPGQTDGGNLPGQTDGGNDEPQPNPNQALLDQIAQLSGELGVMGSNIATMQDAYNQSQVGYENQIADLSNTFNAQLAEIQQGYADQVALGIKQAQEEEEAARAFMINQARGFAPSNLQIGATYGAPQLAGTQGFKYRPRTTTSQGATAFTAPTLAAAAMTPQQQLQPTVLNV